MDAIYFGKPVFTKMEQVGAKFYRYSLKGAKDAKHYFFSEPYTLPGEVGKVRAMSNADDYIIEEFTSTKKVKTLNTSIDLGGDPGGRQIISTEIEKNSTVRSASTWDELLGG